MLRSCSEMLPVFVADNQRAAAAEAPRVRREGRHDRPVRDGGDLRDPGRLRRGAHQDHPTQRYVAPCKILFRTSSKGLFTPSETGCEKNEK